MGFYQEFSATGSPQKLSLQRGTYKFECWGASGGDESNTKGASGAYVSGVLSINRRINFYLFVGKKGEHGAMPSFNGGGRGSERGASGGGATDIRLINDEGIEGLKSRIIVASGGGGANCYPSECAGGCGGILTGEKGYTSGPGSDVVAPTGGTQTSGGEKGHSVEDDSSRHGTDGTFGSGGMAAANENFGSGAGGGYFGGGGGSDSLYSTASGAGGSSYISGYPGCKAINKTTTSIEKPIMLDHPNHYSGLVFHNIEVVEGKDLKRNKDGLIRITILNFDNCSMKIFNKYHESRFSILYFIVFASR